MRASPPACEPRPFCGWRHSGLGVPGGAGCPRWGWGTVTGPSKPWRVVGKVWKAKGLCFSLTEYDGARQGILRSREAPGGQGCGDAACAKRTPELLLSGKFTEK